MDPKRGGASWLRVSSSNLDAVIFWHRREGVQRVPVLGVRFKGGRIYQYPSCPEAIYHALLAAPSKGTYHAAVIKKRWPKPGDFEGPLDE